ncbi:MAG: 30S ribosomal protein S16 [Chloroflexi bacterium]|nr:30S ribosomal protein S16 [Chloroflexota bacterium]
MLRIRLRRTGKKKRPSYRIVVADSRSARQGPIVELVGFYDPLPATPAVSVDREQALKWLQRGAVPSEAVQRIFRSMGLMEKKVSQDERAN